MFRRLFIYIILSFCFLLNIYPQKNTIVIFRFDDYGIDNEEFYLELFKVFEKHRSKFVIGVVPFKKVSGNLTGLTERQKEILLRGLSHGSIEVAQHGFTHENNNKEGDIRSEFYGLPYATQFEKIKTGKEYLEKELGIKITTFIPPENSYDFQTLKVLDNLGFSNISSALYGHTYFIQDKLSYIPYTTTLDKVESVLGRIEDDRFIIIMLHYYDFNEDSDYKEYRTTLLTLDYLDRILSLCNDNDNITISTYNDIHDKKESLSWEVYKSSIYPDYLLKIPPFFRIKTEGYYPVANNAIKLFLIYKIYPPLLYLVIIIFGYLFYKFLFKINLFNLNKNKSIYIIIFITALVVIAYNFLGSVYYLGLIFAYGLLIGLTSRQLKLNLFNKLMINKTSRE